MMRSSAAIGTLVVGIVMTLVPAGSFEGHGFIGLGVRARLPFRVFTLASPGDSNRLVIDVAHSW